MTDDRHSGLLTRGTASGSALGRGGRFLVLLLAGTAAVWLTGCGARYAGPGVSLSGPNHVLKPGQPFTSWTTVSRPGTGWEFAYFLVIKPPRPRQGGRQQSTTGEGSAIGLNSHAKSKIAIDGKELTVDYQMTARPDGTVAAESFVIGGKKHSLDKGRVLLVDLSTEPISIVAHDVKLSTAIPDLLDPAAADSVAESALNELEKDPAIAEFVRPLR